MNLIRKVRAVERVFGKLDKEIAEFQLDTGLKCLPGCGKCCHKPDIEATILEFLPLAHFYYEQHLIEEKLTLLSENSDAICRLFSLHVLGKYGGMCSEYPYRGLICRLFGFSAGRDKYGKARLITCNTIKTGLAQEYNVTKARMAGDLKAPVWSNYYTALQNIDFNLGRDHYPINQAIRLAMEYVLQYYSYRRPRRRGLRKAG